MMDIQDLAGKIGTAPTGKMTWAERRSHLWVARLRKVPVYMQMLERLIANSSAAEVARWVHDQPDAAKGELAGSSYETVRAYVNCLNFEVKKARTKVVGSLEPTTIRLEVAQGPGMKVATAVRGEPSPEGFTELELVLIEQLRKREAREFLLHAFAVQKRRVDELRELEKKSKMPMPWGNKALEVLAEIAAEIHKVELGEEYLKVEAACHRAVRYR